MLSLNTVQYRKRKLYVSGGEFDPAKWASSLNNWRRTPGRVVVVEEKKDDLGSSNCLLRSRGRLWKGRICCFETASKWSIGHVQGKRIPTRGSEPDLCLWDCLTAFAAAGNELQPRPEGKVTPNNELLGDVLCCAAWGPGGRRWGMKFLGHQSKRDLLLLLHRRVWLLVESDIEEYVGVVQDTKP